jgi:hypothetical protein
MLRKYLWVWILIRIYMFLAYTLQLVIEWDFISEDKISESGYKRTPTTIPSLASSILDEYNNIQAITAVTASHVSFSIICNDQECPASMWY